MFTLLVIGTGGILAKGPHSRKLQAPVQDSGQNPVPADTKKTTDTKTCPKNLPYLWPSDGICHETPQIGDQDCKDLAKPYMCGDKKCYKNMSECKFIVGTCHDSSKLFSCFTGDCTEDWESCQDLAAQKKINRDCENPLV